MRTITFEALADYLKHGREIEFAYNGKQYSITNHSGYWYLHNDTDNVLLDTPCRFEEKDILVDKIAAYVIDGKTIAEIFDAQLFAAEQLSVI